MSSALLQARTVARSGRAVVFLVGELDLDTAPRVRDAVEACLAEQPEYLCIDLTEVVFCDCAGLNALLSARLEASRAGVELRVRGVRSQVGRLFELTGSGAVLLPDTDGPAVPPVTRGTVRDAWSRPSQHLGP